MHSLPPVALGAFLRSRNRRESKNLNREGSHEHQRAIYPAAGGHHPADGGGGAGRVHRVQAIGGRSSAPGRLSYHLGVGESAGRKRPDHGLLRRDPPGATVRPHRRHYGDDLAEPARANQRHDPIRFGPRYQWRGAGRGGGDQRGAHLSARRTCPATLPIA